MLIHILTCQARLWCDVLLQCCAVMHEQTPRRPVYIRHCESNHAISWRVQVGVVHDIRLQELRLYTDYGRCCRPLYIVKDQELIVKKKDIIALQNRSIRDQDDPKYDPTNEEEAFTFNSLVFNGAIE